MACSRPARLVAYAFVGRNPRDDFKMAEVLNVRLIYAAAELPTRHTRSLCRRAPVSSPRLIRWKATRRGLIAWTTPSRAPWPRATEWWRTCGRSTDIRHHLYVEYHATGTRRARDDCTPRTR